ncbi:alkaline phosphatase family protein [Metabacillus arenae]|uniref:Alkaline phosphatase family protein n=1 Tax=Metabacillus arenae TaxID=2771434 RepID=A0A926RXZ2_9BACI|nr:alkaline phosphatase family protein [Metabacillus arenae]MBD1380657.1 alkaline phosphatase family protein [Metabacillus arenae]
MTSTSNQKKRIILLMIDTFMDSALQAALKAGRAPALKFLMENGRYFSDVVSPFPTMSVTVDSTLLMGVNSDKHKIPGLVWYNQHEKRLINYGSHIRELYKLGLKQSTEDIFYNLNHEHLSKQYKTIHEILHEKGIQTASINALLYRGNTPSFLKIPFLLSMFSGLNSQMKSYSPDFFSYGLMHKLNPLKKYSFFWKKYGFNDKFSRNELTYLINKNKLPPFSIVYFPDLDQSVHKNGREDVTGIEKVDQQLQKILNQYPSWEVALTDNIWILLGDNGQAWIKNDRKKALIDLKKILCNFNIVKLKKGVTSQDEIVLGVNERMAFIYSLDVKKVPLEKLASPLEKDDRIDIIARKKEKTVTVTSGLHSGHLHFYPGSDFTDEYGQSWSIDGNKEILNIEIKDNKIIYGDYPDALARLYTSLFSHKGEYMIVSARPGYEFIGEGSPTHVGGASHGGLHRQDSLVSMIICGTDSSPNYLRLIDMKDWLLTLIT